MKPTTESASAPPSEDDAKLRRQLRWLHFKGELEAQFRSDYENRSLQSRLTLCVIAIIAVALSPVYDFLLLHPPQALVPAFRLIQFGIEIPGLLLGLLCLFKRLRRWQPLSMLIGALAVAGGLYAQRVISAPYGFHVPFHFAAIVIAAVYLLGGLRFFYFLPWALLIAVSVCVAEIAVFGAISESFYNCISLAILFSLLSTGGYLMEHTARENWYRRRQLSMLALHDPLTDLPNRRHFDSTLTQLLRSAARTHGHVALMLIDIDDFKSYNDRYGHPAGDACLRRIGVWLGSQMRRPLDFCARIGGEEFVAVWYDAKPEDARRLAEQLRAGIAKLGITHEGRSGRSVVTASGGLVAISDPQPPEAARSIAKMLVREADDLLYQAKDAGRDRLLIAG